MLLWPGFDRQLTVRGDVVADDPASAAAAWAARPDHLRLLAWLNTDELAGRPLGERRERWADLAARPLPPAPADSWVGYRLQPREYTFWAARPDTASRRLQYRRDGAGWRWAHRAG